ncbi:DUF2218 domain-containing protein [Pacificibacter sp.]|uniref:DUF2218 domain-containing protein n=1 Tax=Pacificibacter sp. TaxID=1917866 RepID=UPI0032191413
MNHHPKSQAAGRAQTPSASRYLQQLCKHWSRKGKAEFDASKGCCQTNENSHRISGAA